MRRNRGKRQEAFCYRGYGNSGLLSREWVSQAEWIWQLQSGIPKQVGYKHNSVPYLAKAGQPSSLASSRRPRQQREPKEKG